MIDINNLPGFLTIIFGCFVFLYAYSNFSNNKIVYSYKTHIIIFFTSLLIYINNCCNDPSFKIPVAFVILAFFFFLITNISFFENLFLSFFIGVTSIFNEFILSIVICLIFNNISLVTKNWIVKDIFSLFCFWSFYGMCRMPYLKNLYKKMLLTFENSKNRIIYICIFLAIVYFLYTIYVMNYTNFRFYIFSILIILFISTIIIFYFKELHNNNLLNIKNKYLIDNQMMYNSVIDDFRMIKHNLLNDFLFISTLCNSKTQEIIKKKIKKYNFNNHAFISFDSLPEGLQGIIYFKTSTAQTKNIDFYLENHIYFETQQLNNRLYIDICEIISIALDNAIEATSQAKNKAIYMSIKEINNKVIIEILNTYINDIDLDNIGNKNYSTKKIKSGLGLFYIKQLNKNIHIKTSFIHDLFKIKIIAKK